MKDLFELLSIFTSFLHEIKNQYGRVIEILSDNAKEYFVYGFKFTWYVASVHLSTYVTAKRYSRKIKWILG